MRGMNEVAKEIAEWRERKGFHTPICLKIVNCRDLMLGKLMLVCCEVSEAAEAVRHNDIINFREELADTFIRLLDICGTMEIDIESEITAKMLINEKRPVRHGKFTSL